MGKPGHFGTQLAHLRADRGWTKTELARRTHISVRTLSAYETGDMANPTWNHVCALCRAFKVSCEVFREDASPADPDGADT